MATTRIAETLLIGVLIWGVLAFGAVYPWAYWPLVALSLGVAALGAFTRLEGGRQTALDMFWVGCAAIVGAIALQLVPLPLTRLASVSPASLDLINQLDPAVAFGTVSSHPSSIAPRLTATSLALMTSNVLLMFGCVRLFSYTGVRRAAQTLVVVGVVVALIGIIQKPLFAGKIYGFWKPLDGGSPFGPFVNKNHFAGWMLMTISLTFGLLCGGVVRAMRGVKPDWRERLVWFSSPDANRLIAIAGAGTLMALSLVLTLSRSAITALAATVAVTGAFLFWRLGSIGRRTIAIGYLLLLVFIVVGWAGVDTLAARFSQPNWSELDGRRAAWQDATQIVKQFPIIGTGLNTYGVATLFYQKRDARHHFAQAHNDYLQIAAEGGALVAVPVLFTIAAFVVAVRRRFVEEVSAHAYWLRVGAVTGLAAIALQETVDFSLQMPGNAALCAVLCGIALHQSPRSPRSPEKGKT